WNRAHLRARPPDGCRSFRRMAAGLGSSPPVKSGRYRSPAASRQRSHRSDRRPAGGGGPTTTRTFFPWGGGGRGGGGGLRGRRGSGGRLRVLPKPAESQKPTLPYPALLPNGRAVLFMAGTVG